MKIDIAIDSQDTQNKKAKLRAKKYGKIKL